MIALNDCLEPIRLQLGQLILDPNNPRFAELGETVSIPEARSLEPKIQQLTYVKMRSDSFDVSELKDTIKTVGFLPMDRIVVRKWQGTSPDSAEYFVVVEGNRRVTALKWLVELHESGKETFNENQIQNFTQLECLLLNEVVSPENALLILPGLRHVSGVKEWGPYQKAKAVFALRRSGLNPQEAAQSLGLSTRAANNAHRCYLALEQMKMDDEYGEAANPRLYSYFEETFRRPSVKSWLSWNDIDERFANAENLKEFYSWIVVSSDDPESTPKLPEAKSIRDLGVIINDAEAMSVFRSPDGSLTRAIARYEIEHPDDWHPKIRSAITALSSLTPDMLRAMDESSIKIVEDLKARVETTLADKAALSR